MRTILGALALVIAAPAVAQGSPASGQHAGHAQLEEQRGERQQDGHDGDHKMDGCKDCCDKMKQHGHPMDNSGKHEEGAAAGGHSQRGN